MDLPNHVRRFLVFIGLVVASTSWADRASDGERAFLDALHRDASGDASALEAFEALGAASPPTIWSDDAYVHAARLAERRGELARARSNYEKAIALGGDDRLAARARSELARLIETTGGGQWDTVAAEHERLESLVYGGRDPQPALRDLEALVTAHPNYPRRVGVVLVIAEGWEREGQAARAIEWLANTAVTDLQQQHQLDVALIHALIRHRDLGRARTLLQAYRGSQASDPTIVRELNSELDRELQRRWWRRLAWGIICLAGAIALADLRRTAGSWRGLLRIARRPPTEVLFLTPVAAVLAIAAATGNTLVGPAVWQILASGIAVAWISGGLFDLVRSAQGNVGIWRVVAHAGLATTTLFAVAYLALDHEALIDLLRETAAHGPAMR